MQSRAAPRAGKVRFMALFGWGTKVGAAPLQDSFSGQNVARPSPHFFHTPFTPCPILACKIHRMARLSTDERIARMTFASVYPHYVAKVTRKGRTLDELHAVMCWLTGYTEAELLALAASDKTFTEFFAQAELPPSANRIQGLICGIRVEDIENPLTQQVRYLDKVIDELARGKKLSSILRD